MSMPRIRAVACAMSAFAWASAMAQEGLPPSETEGIEFFEKNIRPVFHAQCMSCHGPEKQKAGLRLDSLGALLRGGVVASLRPLR